MRRDSAVLLVTGDTNYDGVLDVENDFQAILDNFLQPVFERSNGDLDGSELVDFDDFRLWKDEFVSLGGSLAGVDLGPFSAGVPEPSGLALLVISLFCRRLAPLGDSFLEANSFSVAKRRHAIASDASPRYRAMDRHESRSDGMRCWRA